LRGLSSNLFFLFSFSHFDLFIFFFSLLHRFDIWCHALKEGDAEKNWEETLPPVDVMMVC